MRLQAARGLIAGSWQYRDRIGRFCQPREAVMPSKKQSPKSKRSSRSAMSEPGSAKGSPSQARPCTKKQQLIELLSGANPVAVDSLSKTLCWQPHTVRAAIIGLRKAGLVVENSKGLDGGGTCYRIVGRHQPSSKAV
jgi:hypothetical protein